MADKLFVLAVGTATLVIFTAIVVALLAIAGLEWFGRTAEHSWRRLAAVAHLKAEAKGRLVRTAP